MKKNKDKARPQAKDAQSAKRLTPDPANQGPAQEPTKVSAPAARSIFDPISLPIVIVLVSLLSVLAFKNVSYPLLWNDEAETTMTAQQVLKYGYPKVHDGKNTIFLADNPLWLGYKPLYDANISIPWGSYYFAAIGVWLAKDTNDIYQKTALVRIPFVMAGLIGLLIFAFSMRGFFLTPFSFKVFLSVFLVFEMLSVNILLHIREARYYALVILICACFFYVFSAFHFHRKYSKARYMILLTIILVIAYNVNAIVYGAIFATTGLFHCYAYFNYRWRRADPINKFNLKDSIVLLIPLLLSVLAAIPELVFFETFKTAEIANSYYKNNMEATMKHFEEIFFIMTRFDLLYAFLVIKVLRMVYSLMLLRKRVTLSGKTKKMKAMSFFMSLFFIVFILITVRMPFVFTRYFIALQPVLILLLLTDVLIILDYAALLNPKRTDAMARFAIVPVTCLVCLINLVSIDNHISDYLYQCTHPYYGPLDYYIPALKERYKHPENIVIATNYEELSYEYYLDCKVIWGYQNQYILAEDSIIRRYSPDVLIVRPAYVQDNKPYNYYLQHAQYQKITFPVIDQPVNNMADLHMFVTHQFRTNYVLSEEQKAYMFVKVQP